VKALAGFVGATAAILVVVTGVLLLVYPDPASRRAIGISAAIAFFVQAIAFGIVRLSAEKNVIAGWGLGALLRFLVFGVYALVLVKALALPSGAAMISLAAFLFLSTLVEPLLLKL
jgi:hypothetical protein